MNLADYKHRDFRSMERIGVENMKLKSIILMMKNHKNSDGPKNELPQLSHVIIHYTYDVPCIFIVSATYSPMKIRAELCITSWSSIRSL